MSWLSLTLVSGDKRVPIDINFRWVVSVRQTDDQQFTMLRVNGVTPAGDNLVYIVEEAPEVIWDAWCKLLKQMPPQRCGTIEQAPEEPAVRPAQQRVDGSTSRTTRKKPKGKGVDFSKQGMETHSGFKIAS